MESKLIVPALFIGLLVALPVADFTLRWLRHRRIPVPVEGQVWRSRHSGQRIFVQSVKKYHDGTLMWDYCFLDEDGDPLPVCMSGWGVEQWRAKIDGECRILESVPAALPQPTTEPAQARV